MARLSRERVAARLETNDPRPLESARILSSSVSTSWLTRRTAASSIPSRPACQLPASTVDRLKCLAAVELKKNPEFQRLIRDLSRSDEAPLTKDSFVEGVKSGLLSPDAPEAVERK